MWAIAPAARAGSCSDAESSAASLPTSSASPPRTATRGLPPYRRIAVLTALRLESALRHKPRVEALRQPIVLGDELPEGPGGGTVRRVRVEDVVLDEAELIAGHVEGEADGSRGLEGTRRQWLGGDSRHWGCETGWAFTVNAIGQSRGGTSGPHGHARLRQRIRCTLNRPSGKVGWRPFQAVMAAGLR